MDIIDFIPSKNVRKYLRDIGYKLDIVQAFMLDKFSKNCAAYGTNLLLFLVLGNP